jgi:hypothetical protein
MEYAHHGDPLVPRQQRFGRYTRSLMKGPTIPGTNRLVPLNTARYLDTRGWLNGVPTFNFHTELPHYAVTTDDPKRSACCPVSRSTSPSPIRFPGAAHAVGMAAQVCPAANILPC